MDKSPGYTISSENPDFATKVHDVFSSIDAASSNMVSSDSAIESDDGSVEVGEGCARKSKPKKADKKAKSMKPPAKPDYIVNPSRYTKYSLEDTELADNRSNAQIAFQFLQELEDRKKSAYSSDDDPAEALEKPHVFRMPGHVVGAQNPVKDKVVTDSKKLAGDASSCDKVELEHLEENISAKEFASEIAAKLDDSISRLHSDTTENPTIDANKRHFKSVPKKDRKHIRIKLKEDE